jgi:hypothetical protein
LFTNLQKPARQFDVLALMISQRRATLYEPSDRAKLELLYTTFVSTGGAAGEGANGSGGGDGGEGAIVGEQTSKATSHELSLPVIINAG